MGLDGRGSRARLAGAELSTWRESKSAWIGELGLL